MSQPQKWALIVDDEAPIRYAFSKHLEHLGYKCVAVSSGQEAIDKVAHQEFALVMLDVRMPGMSGLELLTRLRADQPEPCVVMLSAVVDAAVAAQAAKLGADDYVTKPCSLDYLSERLDRARKHRERARHGEALNVSPNTKPTEQANLAEVTEDLIQQQIAAFDRATSHPIQGEKAPRQRRWWPWAR